MEFGQFVIMFKALYLEGFARPLDGVRVIIRVLLEKFRQAGGERRMKCGVAGIVEEQGRAAVLKLDDGTEVTAEHVISSVGYPETLRLCSPGHEAESEDCCRRRKWRVRRIGNRRAAVRGLHSRKRWP